MTQNLAWPVLANSFQGSLFPLSLGAKDPGNEVLDAEDYSLCLLFLR